VSSVAGISNHFSPAVDCAIYSSTSCFPKPIRSNRRIKLSVTMTRYKFVRAKRRQYGNLEALLRKFGKCIIIEIEEEGD